MTVRTLAAVAVLALGCATPVRAQDAWERARDAARAELSRFRESAQRQIAAREGAVADLRRELLDVSGRASEAEIDAVGLAARLEAATRERDGAQVEADEVDDELAGVTAAVAERSSAAESRPESRAAAAALARAIAEIEQRLEAAGSIRAEGSLVRVGELHAIEVLPGDRAIVGRPGRGAPVGPIGLPGAGALLAAVAGGGPPPFVPVDPTGRLSVKAAAVERDLAGWFRAGGPIAVVIVVLGTFGLLLGLARLAFVLKERPPRPEDVARAREAALAGNPREAAGLLRARRGAIHEALAEVALVEERPGEPSKESRVEQILLRTVDRFERFLHLIAVLAAVSPLLGLLGTVVGMIRMFDAMAGGPTGASHVESLSAGIGEALITTEAGLMFAIPLILLHAVISARADRLESALEDAALQVAGKVDAS